MPEYRKLNDSNKVRKINIKNKNYFISFYGDIYTFKDDYELLERNGLIKSEYKYGKNNLLFFKIKGNPLIEEKHNISNLNRFQKVYSFFNANSLFKKNIVYKFYADMKKMFNDDFNYMPETYCFPEEKNIIDKKFKNYTLNLSDLWLVKPIDNFGGTGITFFNSLGKIKIKEFILTKYIKDVNLIKGKKYDLRLYVLITGLKPLRIYLYNEGLVRISSERYSLNASSIENKFIHLTNIKVNQINKNYIIPNNTNDENSSQWNFYMFKKFLQKFNVKWDNIREMIKDIIIKSIISCYKNLTEKNEYRNKSDQNFFHIFGYDILINDKYIPKLLEINFLPSMRFHNKIQKLDKTNLFFDTINLVGIVPYSKKSGEPLNIFNKKKTFKTSIDININNALCEYERPRGNYELIFPTVKNINKYIKYFIYNTEENKKFWQLIRHLR